MVGDKQPVVSRKIVAKAIANAILRIRDNLLAAQDSAFFDAAKTTTSYTLHPLFLVADELQVFDLVNSYLALEGCPPMRRDPDGDGPTVRLY